mmetsp:Transcript_10314/g.10253  ORF Transcript_10314/g.10253 Transcript_10314/m.10253 type:complete len:155 (-) Transcript_10314:29-493(-)
MDQMNLELENFRVRLEQALNNGQVEQAIQIMTELRNRNVEIPISIEIPDYPVNNNPSYSDPPYQNLSQVRTQQVAYPQSYNPQLQPQPQPQLNQHQVYSSTPSMSNAPLANRDKIKAFLELRGVAPINATKISKQAQTMDHAIEIARKMGFDIQ